MDRDDRDLIIGLTRSVASLEARVTALSDQLRDLNGRFTTRNAPAISGAISVVAAVVASALTVHFGLR